MIMVIGIPKEIKNNENRVSITPAGVHVLAKEGHTVLVEQNAGTGSGIEDSDYAQAGAVIVPKNTDVFERADIIVKVKEPLESEYNLLKTGQTLFTYLHLAPNPSLTKALLRKKIAGIAYETIQLANGSLPLLVPMSEVAGRMSIQVGASLLQKYNGGSGMLLGGVPGVLAQGSAGRARTVGRAGRQPDVLHARPGCSHGCSPMGRWLGGKG
jgi:alanine dehydrogenase